MNVSSDLPFGLTMSFNFRHLIHGWWEMLISFPIFTVDAVITPWATLVIGSLFLCASANVKDLLLHSCACAFISGIDNYILELGARMKKMAGSYTTRTVYLPYRPRLIFTLELIVCKIPLLPGLFVWLM